MSLPVLQPLELALASLLILINGAVSLGFRLGLERQIAVATLRMVAQLALVGLLLHVLLEQTSPLWTLVLAAAMIGLAGHEAQARGEARIAGWLGYGLGTGTLLLVGTAATLLTVAGFLGATPWHAPRVLLPVLGMVLGNVLTGIGLVLETMAQAARRERDAIEARLALGETRFAALSDVLRQALRTAMMPVLNAMATAGVVALPGVMTGQLLAGADAVEAAKIQILLMLVLAGATAAGIALAGLGAVLLITDGRHRLRLERIGMRADPRPARPRP